MADVPVKTILIPNTQQFYCQFNNFCNGGIARWMLARGPARNLWIPVCQACGESIARELPDRLITVAVEGAIARDKVKLVVDALPTALTPPPALAPPVADPSTSPGVFVDAPATPARPTAPRDLVLEYVAQHATDSTFLNDLASALEIATRDVPMGSAPPMPPPPEAKPPAVAAPVQSARHPAAKSKATGRKR